MRVLLPNRDENSSRQRNKIVKVKNFRQPTKHLFAHFILLSAPDPGQKSNWSSKQHNSSRAARLDKGTST